MSVRDSTASGDSVQSVPALVSAFEGVLIDHAASALKEYRDSWSKGLETNHGGLAGAVIFDPFHYAQMVRAFGHQTVAESERYVTAVLKSEDVLPPRYRVEAIPYDGPADPRIIAQHGRAYSIVITLA